MGADEITSVMKNNIRKIIASPVTLVVCFSIILVGSPYFGGPYLFFVIGSLSEGLAYGIIGIGGILITLSALYFRNMKIRLLGNCLMILSLAIYFSEAPSDNLAITFFDIIPLITIGLFSFISINLFIRAFADR
jgi:hypothetical protein